MSEPTVYRRLERLREYDQVSEDIQPVTDGKNFKLYRTKLDGIELAVSQDGFEITASPRERMADRFTQFVEGFCHARQTAQDRPRNDPHYSSGENA